MVAPPGSAGVAGVVVTPLTSSPGLWQHNQNDLTANTQIPITYSQLVNSYSTRVHGTLEITNANQRVQ